ncbi:hypothetical protein SNEBB_001826 [Seison nebaliae]|nr:hypothetical protein SNEBB_001826 [Seison nebaliae]
MLPSMSNIDFGRTPLPKGVMMNQMSAQSKTISQPNFGHLTDEERQIIMDVMKRDESENVGIMSRNMSCGAEAFDYQQHQQQQQEQQPINYQKQLKEQTRQITQQYSERSSLSSIETNYIDNSKQQQQQQQKHQHYQQNQNFTIKRPTSSLSTDINLKYKEQDKMKPMAHSISNVNDYRTHAINLPMRQPEKQNEKVVVLSRHIRSLHRSTPTPTNDSTQLMMSGEAAMMKQQQPKVTLKYMISQCYTCQHTHMIQLEKMNNNDMTKMRKGLKLKLCVKCRHRCCCRCSRLVRTEKRKKKIYICDNCWLKLKPSNLDEKDWVKSLNFSKKINQFPIPIQIPPSHEEQKKVLNDVIDLGRVKNDEQKIDDRSPSVDTPEPKKSISTNSDTKMEERIENESNRVSLEFKMKEKIQSSTDNSSMRSQDIESKLSEQPIIEDVVPINLNLEINTKLEEKHYEEEKLEEDLKKEIKLVEDKPKILPENEKKEKVRETIKVELNNHLMKKESNEIEETNVKNVYGKRKFSDSYHPEDSCITISSNSGKGFIISSTKSKKSKMRRHIFNQSSEMSPNNLSKEELEEYDDSDVPNDFLLMETRDKNLSLPSIEFALTPSENTSMDNTPLLSPPETPPLPSIDTKEGRDQLKKITSLNELHDYEKNKNKGKNLKGFVTERTSIDLTNLHRSSSTTMSKRRYDITSQQNLHQLYKTECKTIEVLLLIFPI